MIRAVIFDFDGLILDTETALYESWLHAYAEFGCTLPLELWAANVGGYSYEVFHPLDYLEAQAGQPIDRDAVNARRRAWYLDRVHRDEAMPGARHVLEAAREMGLRIGLSSSSDRSWVHGHLERLGLAAFFEYMSCGDEVLRAKPDPDLYLRTLRGLGVDARETFALEDSIKGVAAAKAAKLYCVAVPNPVTACMDLGAADRRIASLRDVPFEMLVRDIGKAASAI